MSFRAKSDKLFSKKFIFPIAWVGFKSFPDSSRHRNESSSDGNYSEYIFGIYLLTHRNAEKYIKINYFFSIFFRRAGILNMVTGKADGDGGTDVSGGVDWECRSITGDRLTIKSNEWKYFEVEERRKQVKVKIFSQSARIPTHRPSSLSGEFPARW